MFGNFTKPSSKSKPSTTTLQSTIKLSNQLLATKNNLVESDATAAEVLHDELLP
jgi:hypothetical protein